MKKKKLAGSGIDILCGTVSIAAFLLLWYCGTNGTELGQLMPGPIPVFKSFFAYLLGGQVGRHTLIVHVGYSLLRVLIGYAIGAVIGVILGLGMGWSKTIEAIFSPLFRIIRPIPPIAWIPISIIWLGLGEDAKIFLLQCDPERLERREECGSRADRRRRDAGRQPCADFLHHCAARLRSPHFCGPAGRAVQ